jgi:hypothetical protein
LDPSLKPSERRKILQHTEKEEKRRRNRRDRAAIARLLGRDEEDDAEVVDGTAEVVDDFDAADEETASHFAVVVSEVQARRDFGWSSPEPEPEPSPLSVPCPSCRAEPTSGSSASSLSA